jgi:hypothetical protein
MSGWNQKVMAIVRKVFTDNRWTIVKQKADQTYKAMHSNNTTVQNAKKRPSQPKRLRNRRKGLKPGKEGFFTPLYFV